MVREISNAILSLGYGQAAWAAIFAALAIAASFASSREGSLWPVSAAVAATGLSAALWRDLSVVIDHARTFGAAHLLPATHRELALWFAATATGSTLWAIAMMVGLAIAAADR